MGGASSYMYNSPLEGRSVELFSEGRVDAGWAARIVYAIEIEPAYVDVTVKRWEDFTGKKAQRNK